MPDRHFSAVLLVSLLTGWMVVCPASGQSHRVVRVSPLAARQAAEVSVAINPCDLDNLVAVSIARGYPESSAPNFAYYSFDGGTTWETTPAPNPDNRQQGDDAVTFDGNGNALRTFISFTGLRSADPQRASNGVFLSKSSDGGKTWGDPVPVVDHINTITPFEDKPWLVVDRDRQSPHSGNIYVSWTRFDRYGSSDAQDTSQIMFGRSTNGGESFLPPIRISDAGGDCLDDDNTVEGAVPAVGIDGQVYVVWAGPRGLEFDMSVDGGRTFGKDRLICDMPGGWSSDVEGILRHNGMPVTAVDHSDGPHRGRLYVNWVDERNGDKDVFVIHSSDSGQSWSPPVRVNDDSADGARDQFFTWMAVDPADGSVNVIFYDRRDTEGTETRLTLARSIDGGRTFRNFVLDQPPFPCFKNVFFGDYSAIDAQQGVVVAAWAHFPARDRLSISAALFRFQVRTQTTIAVD